jgi:hypothetical protein
MDPMDYYFMEEFIFPEQGGVTGTREVPCPWCNCTFELEVDIGNVHDEYVCSECGGRFVIDWVGETSTRVE